MDTSERLYSFIAKSFKYGPVKNLKNKIRPVKHAIMGKRGIYKAIGIVSALERKKGKDVRIVFDVGAAEGEYALHFLKGFPLAKVYCFEPMADSYHKLNKATAPFRDRAVLSRIGFFNEGGERELHVTSYRDASSLLEVSESAAAQGMKQIGTEKISLVPLDDFVKNENIQHIDLLKIDVEGVEKEVLEGGLDTLNNKTDNIFIEISLTRKGSYSPNYIEVLSMINKAGFALVDISDNENFFFSKLV